MPVPTAEASTEVVVPLLVPELEAVGLTPVPVEVDVVVPAGGALTATVKGPSVASGLVPLDATTE